MTSDSKGNCRPKPAGDDVRAIGKLAEQAATRWLREHGLRIVTRNYRCRFGEIDIIACDGDTLIFVEVRYRSNRRFGTPEDSINPVKQRKIAVTAQHFLLRNHRFRDRSCRFDVLVASRRTRQDFDFNWHKAAFMAP